MQVVVNDIAPRPMLDIVMKNVVHVTHICPYLKCYGPYANFQVGYLLLFGNLQLCPRGLILSHVESNGQREQLDFWQAQEL